MPELDVEEGFVRLVAVLRWLFETALEAQLLRESINSIVARILLSSDPSCNCESLGQVTVREVYPALPGTIAGMCIRPVKGLPSLLLLLTAAALFSCIRPISHDTSAGRFLSGSPLSSGAR
jgi:hypothetical protein